MEWSDDALVLGSRRFGESGLVFDVLSREHGRQSALVYGAGSASRKIRPQAGDGVSVVWRGRLAQSLGHFSLFELVRPRAALAMQSGLGLTGLNALLDMAREAVPEGPSLPGVHDGANVVLDALGDPDLWPALYIRWEAGLLEALGYGLDLGQCALTGSSEDLAFVSPKSGRAASRSAAAPFADKLLALPGFLLDSGAPMEVNDLADGFALTGYFLERRVFDPLGKSLPESRTRAIVKLCLR